MVLSPCWPKRAQAPVPTGAVPDGNDPRRMIPDWSSPRQEQCQDRLDPRQERSPTPQMPELGKPFLYIKDPAFTAWTAHGQHGHSGCSRALERRKNKRVDQKRAATNKITKRGIRGAGWVESSGRRSNFIDRAEKIQFSRGYFHTLIPFS